MGLTKLNSLSMPTGSVVQVKQTVLNTTASFTTVNSFTDITGMSVDITPSSSSNKVFCSVTLHGVNVNSNTYLRLLRGSTAIGTGASSSSRSSVNSSNLFLVGTNNMVETHFEFLDSPSTTSATTYKVQYITDTASLLVNRTSGDGDALYTGRTSSTITVMEIKG